MSNDVKRLMQALFPNMAHACRDPHWEPLADVYHAPWGWLVKFDLAGVRPEDISVSVSGSRLIVRGVRRDWSAEKGHRYYRMEIAYSQFQRCLELPDNLESARITTEYADGMLLVHIDMEAKS